ncbi:MAG: hypothetical protein EHM12_11105 [Dehalococcoidia bacterium]|nr:MAG: hypothetical protein EHM12_11105 [Dehalococcoidia bacterium]
MKFSHGNLELKDGQKIILGSDDDSSITWEDNQLKVSTTISGKEPIEDYHLTTKKYVDDLTSTISGGEGTTDHSLLDNLDYDSSGHTGFVSTVQLTTTSGDIISQIPAVSDYYTKSEVDTISGSINSTVDAHKSSADHDSRYYTKENITTSGITISGALSKVYVGVNHTEGTDPLVANIMFGTTSGSSVAANACPYGTIWICYTT